MNCIVTRNTRNGSTTKPVVLGDFRFPHTHQLKQIEYLKVKVMSHVYNESYQGLISFSFFNILAAVIALTYAVLRNEIPPSLLVPTILADFCVFIVGNSLFVFPTDSFLLSKKILVDIKTNAFESTQEDTKFWVGMTPLKVKIGNVCSFETKGFLVFLWGEVVIITIIDLLIAY